MRIAVVEPSSTGGLVHFAYQLCEACAAAGANITLYTGRHYELAEWPHDFTVQPILRLWPIIEIRTDGRPTSRWLRMRNTLRRGVRGAIFLREWGRLTAVLLRTRPDIVQFCGIPGPVVSIFMYALRARRILVTQICHEFEERDAGTGWRALRRRFLAMGLYRQIDEVFFLSEAVRASFLRAVPFDRARTHVIPHGNEEIFRRCARPAPDLRRRYAIEPGDTVALLFGLIRPSKGLEDLLEAFALLRSEARLKLLIVGHPTKFADMPALREKVRQLGIEDRVFIDPRYVRMEEVGALVDLATVVVLPYRNATQSGVLHLAYTFGRPVVASAAGGLGEAVVHGRTGLLIPPGEPETLAAAILEIARHPDRARWMGMQARHAAETKHSWPNIASVILKTYEFATGHRETARAPGMAGQ
jgi:glycosyltransferase involved in cell wall biosynthesis